MRALAVVERERGGGFGAMCGEGSTPWVLKSAHQPASGWFTPGPFHPTSGLLNPPPQKKHTHTLF